MTVNSLSDGCVPDPPEQAAFLPPAEPQLSTDPVEGMLEDMEYSTEDVTRREVDMYSDAQFRVLDVAESAMESRQGNGDGTWHVPDEMMDQVEQSVENESLAQPTPKTEVEPAADDGWLYATPSVGGGGPAVPSGEETAGRPPWPLFGMRAPQARPGRGAGLRTIDNNIAGIGMVCWCPVHNEASSLEVCRRCEFYDEDQESETGWQCVYHDEL